MKHFVWIQKFDLDFAVEEETTATAHVLKLLDEYDWTEQLALLAEARARDKDGEECPPQLGVQKGMFGELIQLMPAGDERFDVRWTKIDPYKLFGITLSRQVVVTDVTGMSRHRAHEVVRRFMSYDRVWLDSQFSVGKKIEYRESTF